MGFESEPPVCLEEWGMRPQLAPPRTFNGAIMQGMSADGIKTAEGVPIGDVFAPLPPFRNKSSMG